MMLDMKVIEQETPTMARNSGPKIKAPYSSFSKRSQFESDSFFDDFELLDEATAASTGLEGLTTGPKRSDDWNFELPTKKYTEEEDNNYSRPKPKEATSSTAAGDEAQKKFGKAKAISSDQFFSGSSDNDYERRTNLSRFEGSTSISSADYFGDGRQRNEAASYSYAQNVDLDDVKESVRQGVTKVAGKLSNLANGVMSSIQEKYGY
jgi:ADP-ribosylation factor GTPase-activating protein 2/3